jgi:C_GCAxxG_C_C family probable redox protein
VFSAVAEQMGMDYQTAVKVSSGFGGGMNLGSVCGAVTGGIMAIGLKYGAVDLKAQAEAFERNELPQTARMVREFADRFKAQYRSINCPELVGVDLSKPEGLKAAKDALQGRGPNLFAVCPGIVRDAAKILNELLNDAPR